MFRRPSLKLILRAHSGSTATARSLFCLPVSYDSLTKEICAMRMYALVSILLITCTTPHAFAKAPFTNLVIFGQTFNDTGNFFNRFGFPPSPPYYEGRFSNGPVWIEHIADGLRLPAPQTSELGGSELRVRRNRFGRRLPRRQGQKTQL